MKQRPVILFLIPHLGGGGAEQVFSHLLKGLDRAKYEIHLGLVTRSTLPYERVPGWIVVHKMDGARVRNAAWKIIRLVRTLKPDLIFSGMAHLSLLLLLLKSLFPLGTRVIIRQNGTLAQLVLRKGKRLPRWVTRVLYGRADRIVCQTTYMLAELSRLLGANRTLRVLPNPIDISAILAVPSNDQWMGHGPHLLAVGRLAHEKGFDMLVEAFSHVHASFPSADLTILGTGSQEQALRQRCNHLQLATYVHFAGHIAQPHQWFRGATAFVSCSRAEALPNALLEAAAGGLPIVALPAAGGLSDLLRGEKGVWLADGLSANALADSLLCCLHELTADQRFQHAWVEGFRMEKAIAEYESLIDEVLREPSE